jgi:Cysteine synthase
VLVFAGSTRNNVFPSVQDLVTGLWPTPLVRLEHFGDVWAKLEFFNPLSRSIKDRTVFFLLRRFLNDGLYGGLVEEASSGNVAVALAALANIYGFRYRAYTTKHLPRTTEVLLRVLGAEVVKVDRDSIDEGFWRWVRDNATRDGAINLNQFENTDNPEGHYYFTGGEIVDQFMSIGRRPRVLIAGMGTGGHVTGIARRLRDAFGDVYVVGVEPAINNVIPGIKRLESGTRWVREVVDEVIDVSLEEAVDGVIRVARSEGITHWP